MSAFQATALKHLGTLTRDASVSFREGRLEAIEVIVADGGRALVVQRTGWGKSADASTKAD